MSIATVGHSQPTHALLAARKGRCKNQAHGKNDGEDLAAEDFASVPFLAAEEFFLDIQAHEGLIFYVRKWLVNADGDMTPERAVDEMCADRQLDLLPRATTRGGRALPPPNGGRQGKNCMKMRPGAAYVERCAGRRLFV